jgi:hypothetical protein
MTPFNIACRQTLLADRLTLGLMAPLARADGAMADPALELQLDRQADALGFAALWTRDVPVMVPQGEEISVLDEPFVPSLQRDLLDDADAPAEPIELNLRTGRHALVGYLDRMEDAGVAHVLLNLVRGARPAMEVVDELGREVLPRLQGHARTPQARAGQNPALGKT